MVAAEAVDKVDEQSEQPIAKGKVKMADSLEIQLGPTPDTEIVVEQMGAGSAVEPTHQTVDYLGHW